MCELLGLCFSKPIRPSISFIGFRQRGEVNRHGWGVAFYPDNSAQVIKEPINAGASELSNFLKDYRHMYSKILLAHVRHATVGSHTRMNTHPFQRELCGRDYVFAHNGHLKDYRKALPLGVYRPVGETDSEHAFCHVMELIRKRGIVHWSHADYAWLEAQLRRINRFGVLNCLLSDGEHLFAYRGTDEKRTLFFLNRVPPYGRVRLLDGDFSIDLGQTKDSESFGFIVATRPLTDEAWIPFPPGHLLVFKDGKTVFSDAKMPRHVRDDPMG
ncbi:class II glutamine amidotransferase [Candidatus Micrarchaeota archaeon]|nr:class II glutamine amidotransferase [Candidatus Micrarchaeota archaeon]